MTRHSYRSGRSHRIPRRRKGWERTIFDSHLHRRCNSVLGCQHSASCLLRRRGHSPGMPCCSHSCPRCKPGRETTPNSHGCLRHIVGWRRRCRSSSLRCRRPRRQRSSYHCCRRCLDRTRRLPRPNSPAHCFHTDADCHLRIGSARLHRRRRSQRNDWCRHRFPLDTPSLPTISSNRFRYGRRSGSAPPGIGSPPRCTHLDNCRRTDWSRRPRCCKCHRCHNRRR